MARVVAFVPDLLFGSNVVGALQAAGHEVRLVGGRDDGALAGADVLVVDLTADAPARIAAALSALSRRLTACGRWRSSPTSKPTCGGGAGGRL